MKFLLSLPPKFESKSIQRNRASTGTWHLFKRTLCKTNQGEQYNGLYELRIKLGSDASRIFYFTYHKDTFVLLNGFLKKTNKTPKAELEKAKKYKNDYEKRCECEQSGCWFFKN